MVVKNFQFERKGPRKLLIERDGLLNEFGIVEFGEAALEWHGQLGGERPVGIFVSGDIDLVVESVQRALEHRYSELKEEERKAKAEKDQRKQRIVRANYDLNEFIDRHTGIKQ